MNTERNTSNCGQESISQRPMSEEPSHDCLQTIETIDSNPEHTAARDLHARSIAIMLDIVPMQPHSKQVEECIEQKRRVGAVHETLVKARQSIEATLDAISTSLDNVAASTEEILQDRAALIDATHTRLLEVAALYAREAALEASLAASVEEQQQAVDELKRLLDTCETAHCAIQKEIEIASNKEREALLQCYAQETDSTESLAEARGILAKRIGERGALNASQEALAADHADAADKLKTTMATLEKIRASDRSIIGAYAGRVIDYATTLSVALTTIPSSSMPLAPITTSPDEMPHPPTSLALSHPITAEDLAALVDELREDSRTTVPPHRTLVSNSDYDARHATFVHTAANFRTRCHAAQAALTSTHQTTLEQIRAEIAAKKSEYFGILDARLGKYGVENLPSELTELALTADQLDEARCSAEATIAHVKGSIAVTEKEIADTSKEILHLTQEIGRVENEISACVNSQTQLRTEYARELKARQVSWDRDALKATDADATIAASLIGSYDELVVPLERGSREGSHEMSQLEARKLGCIQEGKILNLTRATAIDANNQALSTLNTLRARLDELTTIGEVVTKDSADLSSAINTCAVTLDQALLDYQFVLDDFTVNFQTLLETLLPPEPTSSSEQESRKPVLIDGPNIPFIPLRETIINKIKRKSFRTKGVTV